MQQSYGALCVPRPAFGWRRVAVSTVEFEGLAGGHGV